MTIFSTQADNSRSAASAGGFFRPLRGDERRAFVRHAVNCPASLVFMTGARPLKAKLADLSLGGCCIVTDRHFQPGTEVRAEVQFELRGTPFRVIGVTVGKRSHLSFAVRFLNVPSRRREELASLLAEQEAEQQLQREKASSCQPDQPQSLSPDQHPAGGTPPSASSSGNSGSAAKPPSGTDKRANQRVRVDTFAKLTLVYAGICMLGRIEDLSLDGCRLHTEERFSVGIFVRVEIDFCLHGLPFRLAGVTQTIVDQNTIGIRFLDVSERKRQQLTELIAEIAGTEPDA